MSSVHDNGAAGETPQTKKPKLDEGKLDSEKPKICFKGFQTKRILNENAQQKTVFLQGHFGDEDKTAIVILEKMPFSEESIKNILTENSAVKASIQNDIYNALELYPPPEYNGLKTTLIYPATERHITKYSAQEAYLVTETPSDYTSITLPYIEGEKFSIQWVYNILEKKKESERIVFEDTDPETGFILLPDMKWSGNKEDLYLVAIVHKHGIRSLRELTTDHLPLLENILNKGTAAISDKYGVPACQLRVYLHYQPSYYHLHVHFTHLRYDAPGSGTEKAHLLMDVIDNIKMAGDFYQRKTLNFVVRENDGLCKCYKDAGKL